MARIETFGFNDLFASIRRMPPPRDVKEKMLEEGAKIIGEETKQKAETMLNGPYYKGDVKANVIVKKEDDDEEARYITFTPGKIVHKKDVTPGEIAFINEYGAPWRNIKARPFITKAIEEGTPEAVNKAGEIYDEYLDKIGL